MLGGILLCLSCTALATVAQDEGRLTSLEQLCVADQTIGFNWRDGDWVRTRFVEEKYVIVKVEIPELPKKASEFPNLLESGGLSVLSKLGACNPEKFGNEIERDEFRLYNACLRVQEIGEEELAFERCTEMHAKLDGGRLLVGHLQLPQLASRAERTVPFVTCAWGCSCQSAGREGQSGSHCREMRKHRRLNAI